MVKFDNLGLFVRAFKLFKKIPINTDARFDGFEDDNEDED